MADLTDEELNAAKARGRDFRATHPHAACAYYDPATGNVVVKLTTGATFAFLARLVEELEFASDDEIAEVQVTPGGGYGLHWPTRDADLSVGGLMNGVFGTRKWMSELDRRAASPAKAAAARANGVKGGRPRKAG